MGVQNNLTGWGACLLIIFTLIALIRCLQSGEDSIFLIPEKFEGNIIIIFNQKKGAEVEYDKGARVYRIPENGVMKTKFPPNYGTHWTDRFYFQKRFQRAEIPHMISLADTSIYGKNEAVIYNVETGTSGSLHFLVFSVTRINKLDSILRERSPFIWETIPSGGGAQGMIVP
jgi:hypothetical protein